MIILAKDRIIASLQKQLKEVESQLNEHIRTGERFA